MAGSILNHFVLNWVLFSSFGTYLAHEESKLCSGDFTFERIIVRHAFYAVHALLLISLIKLAQGRR